MNNQQSSSSFGGVTGNEVPAAADAYLEAIRLQSQEAGKCVCCGAVVKKYWYKLTPGLVDILIAVLKRVKETDQNHVPLKDLYDVLTPYQTTQMTKLRFHGLIAKHRDEDGKQDGWLITTRGGQFLRDEVRVPLRVQTYRNKVVGHDSATVGRNDLVPADKREYLEQMFAYERATPADMQQASLL